MTRLARIARRAWAEPLWRAYLIWLPINFAWIHLWPAPGGLASWIPVFAFLGFALGWSVAAFRGIEELADARTEEARLRGWARSDEIERARLSGGLVLIASRLGSEDHGDTDQQARAFAADVAHRILCGETADEARHHALASRDRCYPKEDG